MIGSSMWLGERDFIDALPDTKYLFWRDLIGSHGWKRCVRREAYWIGETQDIPHDDNIYRVYVSPDDGHVSVACIGIERLDSLADGTYDSSDKLPDWMQEKLAVLLMMSSAPPTERVVGVGQRMDEDIFWIFC